MGYVEEWEWIVDECEVHHANVEKVARRCNISYDLALTLFSHVWRMSKDTDILGVLESIRDNGEGEWDF